MRRVNRAVLLAAALTALQSAAYATDYTWSQLSGGTFNWNNSANWGGAGFPNISGDTANLAVPLTAALNVALPVDVTLNTASFGSAFATDIGANASGGGNLTFDGTPVLYSLGSGANTISAPIRIMGGGTLTLDTTSTNSLTMRTVTPFGGDRIIKNNLGPGLSLTISNNVFLSDLADTAAVTANVGRRIWFAGAGTTILNGVISNGALPAATLTGGTGQVSYGTSSATEALGNYLLNSANTYTDITIINRGNFYVNNNAAFGTGELRGGNPSNAFGFNLISNDDSRTLSMPFRGVQNISFLGSHSLKFSNWFYQSNARGLFNNLPSDKTLTLDGPIGLASSANDRTLIIDGSGTTVFNGPIFNHRKKDATTEYMPGSLADAGDDTANTGHIDKRGPGVLRITLDNAAAYPTLPSSTYKGTTFVEGGLIEFKTAPAYGATNNVQVAAGGAVGVVSGSTTSDFLTRLKNASNVSGSPTQINSTGGLALSNADQNVNLDFTGSGNMSDVKVVGMSLGAVTGGVMYKGTITPGAAGYRLGGGSQLSLFSANQLTGGNSLTAVNGGTVTLPVANNYTGSTTLQGVYLNTRTQAVDASAAGLIDPGIYVATTLEVGALADGASAIGNASNTANTLLLNGGTLKYIGSSAASTSRLFTIGATGGTLDASGAAPVTFSNVGANSSADVAANVITGTIGANNNTISAVTDTSNLALGMTVTSGTSVGTLGAGLQIIGLTNNTIRLSAAVSTAAANAPLTFTTQNRSLTLSGTNAGANTISGVLADSATGSLAVVKNGGGKWVLGGANTYTGGSTVNAGTLVTSRFSSKLTINAGGRAQLSVKATANDPSGAAKLAIASLSIAGTPAAPTAALDLANNSLVIDYTSPTDPSPLQDTRLRLKAGLGGAVGIMTSSATANTRLGYAESSVVLGPTGGTFSGVSVDGDAVLIKYTYGGDTNLDGKVDVADLGALATAWQQTGVWSNGDSDYSGFVDVADLGILSTNWQKGVTNPPPLGPSLAAALAALGLPNASVPEPTGMVLIGLGATTLVRRRRTNV